MKQCPNCKTTYTDDSLVYCLTDGANLYSLPPDAAAETVNMSFGNQPMRVNIPQDSAPTIFAAPQQNFQQPPQQQPQGKGAGLIIAGVLGLLLLLAIGGFAAYLLLRSSEDKKAAVVVNSPTPIASPTTANDETAKLKEEMANLQKQLQEQKVQKPNLPANISSSPKQTATTARANSPRDGFLALRSEPNSETGYRIAQIPHGATLTVLGCPRPSNVGKMAGRWCQVVYNGQTGWAFDAFMSF